MKKRPRINQEQFQHYLIILAVVDSFLLLFWLDNVFIDHFAVHSDDWYYMYMVVPFLTHPIKNISFTMSIVWVVVVAVERYLAVTQPFQIRSKLSVHVIFLIVFSITINLSK